MRLGKGTSTCSSPEEGEGFWGWAEPGSLQKPSLPSLQLLFHFSASFPSPAPCPVSL